MSFAEQMRAKLNERNKASATPQRSKAANKKKPAKKNNTGKKSSSSGGGGGGGGNLPYSLKNKVEEIRSFLEKCGKDDDWKIKAMHAICDA